MNLKTLSRRFQLLSINPKIEKNAGAGYVTGILHLAPAELSGYNVCAYANACKFGCINFTGRAGALHPVTKTNVIQECRKRRTKLFFENRAEFFRLLAIDLETLQAFARKHRLKPACRLNGTSDIPWERVPFGDHPNVMAAFPRVRFYDYTKYPLDKRGTLPGNYSLTFSLDIGRDNATAALYALRHGHNVAVVFDTRKGKPLPKSAVLWFDGRIIPSDRKQGAQHMSDAALVPVVDGDVNDCRFLDPRSPKGCIVGLRAKGRARHDTSGFVRQSYLRSRAGDA